MLEKSSEMGLSVVWIMDQGIIMFQLKLKIYFLSIHTHTLTPTHTQSHPPRLQVAIVLRKSGSNVRLVVARPVGEFDPLVDYAPGEPPIVPTHELADGQVDMVALGYVAGAIY